MRAVENVISDQNLSIFCLYLFVIVIIYLLEICIFMISFDKQDITERIFCVTLLIFYQGRENSHEQ